jgi:hypothetical protein
MAPAMPSCFSAAESSQCDDTQLCGTDDADRHLRRRRSPLVSAPAAVRSRRENLARHLRMTSRDGARLLLCPAAWCSSPSVASGGEFTNSRSDRPMLELLRATLCRPWSGTAFLAPKLSVRRLLMPRLRPSFTLDDGSEAQNSRGEAKLLRCKEMTKSSSVHSSSESEKELLLELEEEARTEDEKSRSKKAPSSSRRSETGGAFKANAARRAARSRRICI